MKVKTRTFPQVPPSKSVRHLLFIAETAEESRMIDQILGNSIDADEYGPMCKGQVLSDGYAEHYIHLVPA